MNKQHLLLLKFGLVVISIAIITGFASKRNALSSNLHVGPGQTYSTIQAAVEAASSGDIIIIHEGTYRESVTVTKDDITIKPNGTDVVTVSGLDEVTTTWTQDNGNIYYTDINMSLGSENLVFVNGSYQDEARWPNHTQTSTFVNYPTERAEGGDWSTLVEESLPGDDDFWNGATLWINSEWMGWTTSVTDYNASTKTLTHSGFNLWSNPKSAYKPDDSSWMYLVGIKNALDTEKEWWYDEANQRLYLWVAGGGNPGSHTVETKSRTIGLDISGRNNVTIEGINIKAAKILTDENTTYCTLDGITCTFPDYSKLHDADNRQDGYGILIGGHHNVLKNSTISNGSSVLVNISGSDNIVTNNAIYYGNTSVKMIGMLELSGRRQIVSYNSVYESSGRSINAKQLSESLIEYNKVYNNGWVSNDLGLFYVNKNHGENTVIRYNIMYGSKSLEKGKGIYLDNQSIAFIVHHNICYDASDERKTLGLNGPSNYNLVYNNSLYDKSAIRAANWSNSFDDAEGVHIANNIMTDGFENKDPDVVEENNMKSGNAGYTNPGAADFRLSASSPGIDAGRVIPGITNGFVGSAPDQGALEYGGINWTVNVGHDFTKTRTSSLPDVSGIQYRNRTRNGGFELDGSDPEGWTKTDAENAVIIASNSWDRTDANSRTGYYAVQMGGASGEDGLEQIVTGLAPNTTYNFIAWIKSQSGQTGEIGILDFGGTDQWVSSASTDWTENKVTFTTGPTNTSIKLRIKTTGTGTVFFDDLGLQQDLSTLLYDEDIVSTLSPLADAYVNDGTNVNENYGNSSILLVKKISGVNTARKSYLKFDLSQVSSVSNAKLRVYQNASLGGSYDIRVYGVNDDSWGETTITWTNAPANTGTIVANTSVGTTGWFEFDVTSFVQAQSDGMVTFEINTSDGFPDSPVTFDSKESASNQPELVISSSEISLNSMADAYVRDAQYGDINYGTEDILFVKKISGGQYARKSYLKFDLSQVSSVPDAKLRVYQKESLGNSYNIRVYGADDDTWVENTITWNNAPVNTGTILASASVSTAGWIEFDVTSFVQAQSDGSVTFEINTEDGFSGPPVTFDSKESTSNQPELVISSGSGSGARTASSSNILGAQSDLAKSISIYPNPAQSTFSLEIPESASVQVRNMAGQLVDSRQLQPGEFTFEVSGWKRGIYFVNTQTQHEKVVKKVIIE